MTTRPLVPTDAIAKNSNAAEEVRLAFEDVQFLKRELEGISETLNDPYRASMHITKALSYANRVEIHLHDTGIPKYHQEPIFEVRNAR